MALNPDDLAEAITTLATDPALLADFHDVVDALAGPRPAHGLDALAAERLAHRLVHGDTADAA